MTGEKSKFLPGFYLFATFWLLSHNRDKRASLVLTLPH